MTTTKLIFTPCGAVAGSGSVMYGGTIIIAADNTIGTVKHNIGSVAIHPQVTPMNNLGGNPYWVPPAANVSGTFAIYLESVDLGTLGFYWSCGF